MAGGEANAAPSPFLPVVRIVWGICALVSGAGLVIELLHYLAPSAAAEALVPKLSLSYEGNIPTWLASSLLLSCAMAAGAVASNPTLGWRRSWWGVTAAFAWASLDEAAELHEHLGGLFGTGGVLYFDWVISATVLLAALGLTFLPWLRGLPPRTRWRLLLAGGVYVGGALVMELPLGWWTERAGDNTLGYALIDWVEESMELAGAVLMLRALLWYRMEASSTTSQAVATEAREGAA
jgi:hypothetical protein